MLTELYTAYLGLLILGMVAVGAGLACLAGAARLLRYSPWAALSAAAYCIPLLLVPLALPLEMGGYFMVVGQGDLLDFAYMVVTSDVGLGLWAGAITLGIAPLLSGAICFWLASSPGRWPAGDLAPTLPAPTGTPPPPP